MYGAPVSAPMVYDTSPLQRTPSEPLPELPEIQDANPTTLRLQGTLVKRIPGLPAGELGDLSFSNYRQQQIAEEMFALKQATNIHKAYDKIQRAKAKAKGRAAQRWAEGR